MVVELETYREEKMNRFLLKTAPVGHSEIPPSAGRRVGGSVAAEGAGGTMSLTTRGAANGAGSGTFITV